MVFKQSFKYFKNEKINFIEVILKLECLFYQNILYHLILYSSSHFDSNKFKKKSNRKKDTPYFEKKNKRSVGSLLNNAFLNQRWLNRLGEIFTDSMRCFFVCLLLHYYVSLTENRVSRRATAKLRVNLLS